ncbi:MAG: two-component system response regulator [Candidatus Edwardsbacteria bacterium RIFOXYD12_FULL_50_11]|jgi:CheY-like chemotaxis protein|uniref:Two-component system response regulator n=1 Tax=Candidatus Edwardsbacteria bacterium GWF2_54_11 TaxID=1817851 RepID=A0A1F5RG99_9BACT|nr:MAG: two-component system response regulator [Candidatus Edwardsbacteria bacterium RifOxyC12_full_54_24]OGF07080.1 MAG: two-component system response regulator [Candidatus Edwardsbacteria bacterium RifOxyA12_full_54_48]OGF10955.1 MAG: two-component system response regulator [Candidatus Edwardsbacteria bacterium GWE2_54_12]OGF13143.1 MAG: two-component system response regulator [Candidatus Edwardsbacteria bacterium GWF2_54_11]OGF15900.1 MAG: two-component system response regulator [Candidatus
MRDNIPVLLVDDDQVDIMTVQRAFKVNNIVNPLKITGNGREALDYLKREGKYKNPQASPRPGIILLDLNMPIMNGIEFLKIAKADSELRKIPVIVLTTSKEENDRVESFNLSVAGYIIKPVEFEKFVEAVRVLNLYWTLSELP